MRLQIQHDQRVVAFAGDERELPLRVDPQAVVPSAPGQIDARHDAVRRWIDLDRLAAGLHIDEHVPRLAVVLR